MKYRLIERKDNDTGDTQLILSAWWHNSNDYDDNNNYCYCYYTIRAAAGYTKSAMASESMARVP